MQRFCYRIKTVRVYTIPSYAKGAISGYGIPYVDMMEMIDRNSVYG